ncbi:MAG: hypothetical protein IJB90_00470 [Clostridia bacterium]|nr:hypothetical protein [Clostridia bacterium]
MALGFIYMTPYIVRQISVGALNVFNLPKDFHEEVVEHFGLKTSFPIAISSLKDLPSTVIVEQLDLYEEKPDDAIELPPKVLREIVMKLYGGYYSGTPVTGHPKKWVSRKI